MSDERKMEAEIEWREPIDLDAISQLIGATNDFRAGARSYLDGLEGQAIPLLLEGGQEALELSSNVIRAVFDELANTFIEPRRKTDFGLGGPGVPDALGHDEGGGRDYLCCV